MTNREKYAGWLENQARHAEKGNALNFADRVRWARWAREAAKLLRKSASAPKRRPTTPKAQSRTKKKRRTQ